MTLIITAIPAHAVSSLKIEAGYHGGPYYEMGSMSDGALRQSEQKYTMINKAGRVRELNATGTYLSSIMDSVEIGAWDVDTYYICSTDGSRIPYSSDFLLGGGRYYYPNLKDNYDEDSGELLSRKQALKGAVPVKAMLASTVDGSIADRFRLMIGQTDPLDRNFGDSRYNVNLIDTDLTGEPEIEITNTRDELKVGEKHKLGVKVTAYNDKLSEAMKEDIKWESSDMSKALVDDDGTVTVKEGGNVEIKAYFECKDGTKFSDELKITTSKGSGSGGEGEGRGDKAGDGDGSGKGDKQGDGNSTGPDKEGSIRKGGHQITSVKKLSQETAKNALDKINNKSAQGSSGGSDSSLENVKVFEIEAAGDVDDQVTDTDIETEDTRSAPLVITVFFTTLLGVSVVGRMTLFYNQLGDKNFHSLDRFIRKMRI